MDSRKFLLIFGLLIAVAALFVACGPGGASGTNNPGAETITVDASEFEYKPATITAKPGELITINFKNSGTVEHTFVIKEANLKLTAQPGQTVKETFKAPTTPGTYDIHCDVAGHTEAGMQGTLTVAAAVN